MNNKAPSSIRNTSVFRVYQIENDFRRHKDKINRIKHQDVKDKVKKDYSSQINVANELKKNWITAQISKTLSKQKQIYDQNKSLYNQILRVRNRPFDRSKIMSQTNILSRSHIKTSHSVNRQNSQRKIQEQNQKLMEKILTAKSPLAKDKMKVQYKKIKQLKKRLQTHSSLNKTRIKVTLKQLNVKPSIFLPDIAITPKQRQTNGSNVSKNGETNQFIDQTKNSFMGLQKKDIPRKSNYNSFMLPRKYKQGVDKKGSINLTFDSSQRRKHSLANT